MIFEVILILLIMWIVMALSHRSPSENQKKYREVAEMTTWLYKAIDDVCYRADIFPVYELRPSDLLTFTDRHEDRGIIHIVLWDAENERPFERNTVIYAAMHEITHILSPNRGHLPPFDDIEALLLGTAADLGYYDPRVDFADNYPCISE